MDISELLKELEKEEGNNFKSNQENFRLILFKYLKNWKLFAVSILLCMIGAFAFAYYTTPQYLVKASLVLKDQKKGTDFSSNLDDFMGYRASSLVENEAEVFKSENLMIKVCEELNYTNSFYTPNGPYRWKEIYDWEVPVKVYIHEKRTDFFGEVDDNTISIKILDDKTFELETPDGNIKKLGFGDKTQNFYGTFSIEKNPDFSEFLDYQEKPIKIAFFDPIGVGKYLAYSLSVDIVNKQASVIELYLNIGHPIIGEVVLSKLIELYNKEAENEKNLIAKNTLSFIDEQLVGLTSELEDIEREAERFKLDNSITDVGAESQLFLQSTTANRQEISALSVQINVLESIENYINRDGNDFQMVPSTLSINDPTLTNLIADFNILQRERERMLRTTQPNNPIVTNLNQQLISLRSSIVENIKNIKRGLIISRNSLFATANQFQSRASKVPTIERELLDINRQQSIKQENYLLLTQKREEAMLTLAATSVGNIRVIQPPSAYKDPVEPKKILIYAFGLILGMGFPFGIIYLNGILKEKIEYKSDVEKLTKTKILGEISRDKNKNGIVAIGKSKRTLLAEQFRFIRSNLIPFALKNESKVIMVSSGMSGEGKTFFSLNLAISFGLIEKSVVLLEMDLRKPAILSALNIKSKKGISDLLNENNSDIDSIIHKDHKIENVDIIGCGTPPEDPAELLGNENLFRIINQLRQKYDYVILDTAPIGLVSDSFMLAEMSDISIFMVRCNYSTKAQVRTIEDIRKNRRFNNPMIVLNDAEMEITYGYGPKYAAGYYKS